MGTSFIADRTRGPHNASSLRGNLGKRASERSSILNDKSSILLIQSSQIPVRSIICFI